MIRLRIYFLFLVFAIASDLHAKPIILSLNDSTPVKKKVDTAKKVHNPKLATKRSAILPGWGQVYNKQVWKVPIIYAALGITGYVFVDNLKTYKDIQFATNAIIRSQAPTLDSSGLPQIKPYLKNLDLNGLKINRKKFRQQVDYSVLFFILFWGLNVVDATVFGHLKGFDVSDTISGKISLGRSTLSNTTGMNLQLDIHKKKQSKLVVVP
jgi:hypothetical protein